MKHLKLLLTSLSFLIIANSFAQKKDIALTPPMGWNSWNYFACDVSETLIKETADAMVSSGMAAAGYEYVVIDDCWQIDRDENDVLVADPERFPSGIKALADYVHGKGLKFGIYSDAGKKTCQGRPGSLGYEAIDAKTFEDWGVDYLKYDWCAHGWHNSPSIYPIMGAELYKLERPIVYSVCNWGWNRPWEWAPNFAHLWRTTIDIEACFDCVGKPIHKNVEQILDRQSKLKSYARAGAWNDPDMLEVGNGLSQNENIAHFSLWCMMASPLMSGNDLRNMAPEVLDILTNKEVIDIDQDPLAVQGFAIEANRHYGIWYKPLSNGDKALCFFNRKKQKANIMINLQDILNLEEDFVVRDLWKHEDLGLADQQYNFYIEENSVVMLRLTRSANS